MSPHAPSNGESPSWSVFRRQEEACVRFENAWKAGQKPRIEDYLAEWPEPEKAPLLVGLLIIELANRRQAGDDVLMEEYFKRFPDNVKVVQVAFSKKATGIFLLPEDINSSFSKAAPGTIQGISGEADLPDRLGRYRVISQLGAGGFGTVYRGHDDDLRRDVAIKVPHRQHVSRFEDLERFLNEARILAGLDHPHIVPVYDVGRTQDGRCFVVSKFIEGSDLGHRIEKFRGAPKESANLVAIMAEALHYAHRRGLVHRDVKPANILLDHSGHPFLADFGLALKEEDFGKGAHYAGTPAYMSPEQARGEGHRVDGRSDIFSLGVVFYELLAGRLPFWAQSPPELLEQITTVEVRPPRQVDDNIPKELERICLKALAKRSSERYTTARDLSEDLRYWLKQAEFPLQVVLHTPDKTLPGSTAPPWPSPGPDSERPIKIVPKGLRSFDAHDSDFFLELLPGPRDRNGLPDSIRFWKTRIEETDPDKTFAVGLIYGPSGCGKSSLVKAGLLPRLSDQVMVVYVEATAQETDARLLMGLRKSCPDLPENPGLIEAMTALRRERTIPGKKVLIVLDQFEQWLHARRAEENTELVQALRQCDGKRVQGLVMVRDDFWLAVSRFLKELEICLLEGQNSALVDLFDMDHTRKVLAAYGRAFGKLPEKLGETTKDQKQFLEQSVTSLAQEGKVICVRLALFAEMVKGRPWTPVTLKEVGGTAGVGVTFLEETFSTSTAPPEHRYHQKAARAVLRALLPESGTNLKGHMRSQAELLVASEYAGRPKDFEDLIRILDSEIRLITPTDPEGQENSPAPVQPGAKYYQLTHDYLVPSLRDWLTRKQKETRRGRAELLLADRAVVWNARPENRQLPSLLQWLNIWLLTQKKNWAPPQRKMMTKANRYHVGRGLVLALLLALLGWGGYEIHGQMQAQALRRRLLDANTSEVLFIVQDMVPYRRWLDPLLHGACAQAEADQDTHKRLHASLALLPVDAAQVPYLYERLLEAEPHEVPVIRDALLPHRQDLEDSLWRIVGQSEKGKDGPRLRAAAALAKYDPDNPQWEKWSSQIVEDLVSVNTLHLGIWSEAFRPVKDRLLLPLSAVFGERQPARTAERTLATNLLADYAASMPAVLADLLMDADEKQFAVLFPKVKGCATPTIKPLLEEVDRGLQPQWHDPPLDPAWKRPDSALSRKVEGANGILAERFAFGQTLSMEDFLVLGEALRPCGYRPIRFRPYAVGQKVQVAAVWTRDGRDWELAQGLSAEALRQQNAHNTKKSYWPVDVAGYLREGQESYAGLWVQGLAETEAAQMAVGLEGSLFPQDEPFNEKGFQRSVSSFLVGVDGKTRFSEIWTKSPTKGKGTQKTFVGPEVQYSGENCLGDLQVDVAVGKTGAIPTSRERFTSMLKAAEKQLQTMPEDPNARFQRAFASYQLGDNQKALADLRWLIEKFPKRLSAYQYRALTYARLGKAREARADLARFVELNANANEKAYAVAIVAVYLGDETEGMKRLEEAIKANSQNKVFLYDAACAYSVASHILATKDPSRAKTFADRAVVLLKEAITQGYSNYEHMQSDADLDPLRPIPGFATLLQGGKLDRRYTAIWHTKPSWASVEVHGLDADGQLIRGRELMAQGYRPASLSVANLSTGQALVTASVWHRPLVPELVKEKLAKRQANAAVALLRLDNSEKVWPLFRPGADPRVRSYLVHRLSSLGADSRPIIQRLEEEGDLTIRRALLLSLGEFRPDQLLPAARESLVLKVVQLYRDEADPGLHGAAEWLLRRWGRQEKIQAIDREWMKQKEQRIKSIRQELAKDQAKPQWYINSQGQTLVVLPGPMEFYMGSPATEAGRSINEVMHRRRIGRTYALAAKPVTVEQFLRFRKDFNYLAKYVSTLDCPVHAVTWYLAAEYCNWLSEQDGLPKQEWCYQPNPEGVYGEGMRLAPNFWGRTGYRLPTEAEWEYACRAGTVTARYYGESEDLLGHYAWYLGNAQDRSWPVGTLKPNEWGLFDMHGNVWNWCQDSYQNYHPGEGGKPIEDQDEGLSITDSKDRALRGGAFIGPARSVRAAVRLNLVPMYRSTNAGLRPARTFR